MKTNILAFILVGSVFFSGCATMQKVNYSSKDIVQRTDSAFKHSHLVVKEFRDVRDPQPNYSKAMAFLGSPVPTVNQGGSMWYYNHDTNYKSNVVAPWIAEMMVKHIGSSSLFRNVTLHEDGVSKGDLLLEGQIKKFKGIIQKDNAAEAMSSVGMQFGAIGGALSALAVSARKSKFEAETVLMDVRLTEINTGNVLWKGVVKGTLAGEAASSVNGWSAYEKANLSLKAAVESLLSELENVTVVEISQNPT